MNIISKNIKKTLENGIFSKKNLSPPVGFEPAAPNDNRFEIHFSIKTTSKLGF